MPNFYIVKTVEDKPISNSYCTSKKQIQSTVRNYMKKQKRGFEINPIVNFAQGKVRVRMHPVNDPTDVHWDEFYIIKLNKES